MAEAGRSGSAGCPPDVDEAVFLLLGVERNPPGRTDLGPGQSGAVASGPGSVRQHGHMAAGSDSGNARHGSECTGLSGRSWDSESDDDDMDRHSEVDQGRDDAEWSRDPSKDESKGEAQAGPSSSAAAGKSRGKQKAPMEAAPSPEAIAAWEAACAEAKRKHKKKPKFPKGEPQAAPAAAAAASEEAAAAARERVRKGKHKKEHDHMTRQQQVEAEELAVRKRKRMESQADGGWCWEPGERLHLRMPDSQCTDA